MTGTKSEFIPYARQSIDAEDIAAVSKALQSHIITRGPIVEEFEYEFAEYCQAGYAVAFNSASTALLAASHVAEVKECDRLISTPNTFIASVGSGAQYQGTPVFVDIDRATGNFDLKQVEYTLQKTYSRGRSIIMPVHFSGIAVDMAMLDSLINDPKTVVIEDAAHAIGSYYPDGKKVGCCAHSQMTVFSFHPAKTMTTGEGGMVTTNDEKLYHRLKRFRNNGIEREEPYLEGKIAPWYYEVHEMTSNYNFTELQAALGLSQLRRIDSFIEKRRKLVSAYRKQLANVPHITLFTDKYDHLTAFHLFVVQIDFAAYRTSRTELMNKLYDRGIGTQLHYIPIYRHPCIKKSTGDLSSYFPQMEAYYSQALSLPLYYDLTESDVDRVVTRLRESLAR